MTAKKVRFEITTLKEAKIQTLSQINPKDLKSFNFCYAPCLNIIGCKDAKGNWHDINGIGPVAWKILQAIQLNAGIGLNTRILIELTGFLNLNNIGVLTQRIKALRTIFGETKTTERLIVTSKNSEFTVKWPVEASWIWIMPVP